MYGHKGFPPFFASITQMVRIRRAVTWAVRIEAEGRLLFYLILRVSPEPAAMRKHELETHVSIASSQDSCALICPNQPKSGENPPGDGSYEYNIGEKQRGNDF
jgi:hypothetical protein